MTDKIARECGGCTMCCRVMGIGALDKPEGVWCPHCEPGRACRIYDTRPQECRDFYCLWLKDEKLDARWKPDVAKFCMTLEAGRRRLCIHVDRSRPDAWKREPYYAQIKAWSKSYLRVGMQVIVGIGDRCIAVLPNRDVDLGIVEPGMFIITKPGPSGRDYVAYVSKTGSDA